MTYNLGQNVYKLKFKAPFGSLEGMEDRLLEG